jgi:hypothetical protein
MPLAWWQADRAAVDVLYTGFPVDNKLERLFISLVKLTMAFVLRSKCDEAETDRCTIASSTAGALA